MGRASAQPDDWCTPYITESCKTPAADEHQIILGAPVGSDGAVSEAFQEVLDKTADIHEKINSLEDPSTELVLTRKCADVSRLSHRV